MNRIDIIYARQSVDKKDSVSIETQIDFCKYELKGGSCREYADKGFSGKNTDRPKFQELLRDIKQGLVGRVIVYKLDRISRSIIDFASMMELFSKYNVEFVSATEKFDTSTPMGRAMLNICIVFAQLERETIQKRVRDAYYSRCQKGFHASGHAPYGYKLVPAVIDGVNTKMMEADPIAAERVKLIFEMYAKPNVSFGDITRQFAEQELDFHGRVLQRKALARLLRNPVYAQADLEVYDFFKAQGANVVNDAAEFNGINGCYLYQGRDTQEDKDASLKDQILVLAPHEGLVSSETWLACRKKLLNNVSFSSGRKVKSTWLAGKIKCGRCDTALTSTAKKGLRYFYCRRRLDSKSCEGCGTMRAHETEHAIYDRMVDKMAVFHTLTNGNPATANPKLTALRIELAQVDNEIEKLLDTLTGANATLLSYANGKIETLDARRQTLTKAIADMAAKTMSEQQLEQISANLEDWDSLSLEDRRLVANGLIETIRATSETVQIEWKV